MRRGSVVLAQDMILPPTVVTRRDVAQLVLEAEEVDSAMTAADVRRRTSRKRQLRPILSEQFMNFLDTNDIKIENSKTRSELIRQLRSLKGDVPVVHMTFAATADIDSLQRIAAWLRKEIHGQAVIEVGLQPALIAGVHIRTVNSIHDLSLRGRLQGQRELLIKELKAARG